MGLGWRERIDWHMVPPAFVKRDAAEVSRTGRHDWRMSGRPEAARGALRIAGMAHRQRARPPGFSGATGPCRIFRCSASDTRNFLLLRPASNGSPAARGTGADRPRRGQRRPMCAPLQNPQRQEGAGNPRMTSGFADAEHRAQPLRGPHLMQTFLVRRGHPDMARGRTLA